MLTQDVIRHFGSARKTADALGVHRSAVYQWGKKVPLESALKVELVTSGKFKCNPATYLREADKAKRKRRAPCSSSVVA